MAVSGERSAEISLQPKGRPGGIRVTKLTGFQEVPGISDVYALQEGRTRRADIEI